MKLTGRKVKVSLFYYEECGKITLGCFRFRLTYYFPKVFKIKSPLNPTRNTLVLVCLVERFLAKVFEKSYKW